MIIIIIKTRYPSSETFWVAIFGRAAEELGGLCLCTEAQLLPQDHHLKESTAGVGSISA